MGQLASNSRPGYAAVTMPPDQPIGVLVVDDHPAVRAGVCRLLGDQPDLRVIASASSAIAAIDGAGDGIDVAVVDYHLGDRTGLWLARRLSQGDSSPRVLVYSAFSDDALAVAAVIAGVDGLLGKSAIGEELCLAVRRLARGERYLPVISAAVARAMSARVDPRLRPIFMMLVQDIAPARVLEALRISSGDLDAARDAILSMLAPVTGPGRWRAAPPTALHYDRARRRGRPAPASS
jgi:DNA-binding NarL/FixJ family response regulator